MGLISFIKNLFGKKTDKPVEQSISRPEVKKEPSINSSLEETKVIKDRMVEVSEKKEEVKVTAKEIKGKPNQNHKPNPNQIKPNQSKKKQQSKKSPTKQSPKKQSPKNG